MLACVTSAVAGTEVVCWNVMLLMLLLKNFKLIFIHYLVKKSILRLADLYYYLHALSVFTVGLFLVDCSKIFIIVGIY